MIKKIGLPLIALTAMLAFAAPRQADARVRFGVAIGGPVYGPAYVAPVPVSPYNYPYYDPYYYGYAAPYPYVAPAPIYVGPSVGFGYGWGGGYRRPVIVNRGYSRGFRGGSGFRGRR